MPPLVSALRPKLENTVCNARDLAEVGARAALERLAVGLAEPYKHLSTEERELRNRLRARSRQLGDVRDERSGSQEIDRLVMQCAYEYWHRMLFARFLAENDLLIHPEMGVSVSLEECEELAKEEGLDLWTLASRYAAQMLPQIFRPDDPVLQVEFATEHKQKLEKLLAELPEPVFTASDSLGWVYQFWQAKRKEAVNKAGNKIGADELPAVTQLFTEDYMVDFLLHNTLGAWWVANHPGEDLPVEMPYLRFVESEEAERDGGDTETRRHGGTENAPTQNSASTPHTPYPTPYTQIPAAGTFPGFPKTAKELKILDPCCGSGHFLVAEFNLLVPMRMREEGLAARDACDAVLRDNLYGLELDERCTQIAAFALAMAAWTYPGAGGYRPLPRLNIACSGIGIGAKRDDWLKLAGDDERLRRGMSRLYLQFESAPTFGSLINLTSTSDQPLLEATYAELQPMLYRALKAENSKKNYAISELGIAAQGIVTAAELLANKYHLVATNVPYLGQGKQNEILRKFLSSRYPDGKVDLATAFIERCVDMCVNAGLAALVTPQSWLFLGSYKCLRKRFLQEKVLNLVIKLGAGAFETISGEVVNVSLSLITNKKPESDQILAGLDASTSRSSKQKANSLLEKPLLYIAQSAQLRNPLWIISFEEMSNLPLLEKYADSYEGIGAGDLIRFTRKFWELHNINEDWVPFRGTTKNTNSNAGVEEVIYWQKGSGDLYELAAALRERLKETWQRGKNAWARKGIAVNRMRNLEVDRYQGEIFSTNIAAIIPKDESHLSSIYCFCTSEHFHREVRRVDQALKVTNKTFLKVPFDLSYWQQIAEEKGKLPEPYSDDPTQWIFKGIIPSSTEPLQVAVARLLGYRWHEQIDDRLDDLIDTDGIVCLPSIQGEQPAAERLRQLLVKAYGDAWTPHTLKELLTAEGYGDKTLDDWLKHGFFEQHCKLFHQRPFIWHLWDGNKNGFSVLVNYHKLTHKTLETLTYTYLGDWIRYQQKAVQGGESGADAKLLDAQKLQQKLELILTGEQPYDIFVRWKPLEKQAIGWHPDLNDGVRLNIRPFVQANILRKKPTINWNKDRGKNPPNSPWGEDRINDFHLTLEEKRRAREASQS